MIAYFLIVVGLSAGQPAAEVISITSKIEECVTAMADVQAAIAKARLAASAACVSVDLGGEKV